MWGRGLFFSLTTPQARGRPRLRASPLTSHGQRRSIHPHAHVRRNSSLPRPSARRPPASMRSGGGGEEDGPAKAGKGTDAMSSTRRAAMGFGVWVRVAELVRARVDPGEVPQGARGTRGKKKKTRPLSFLAQMRRCLARRKKTTLTRPETRVLISSLQSWSSPPAPPLALLSSPGKAPPWRIERG